MVTSEIVEDVLHLPVDIILAAIQHAPNSPFGALDMLCDWLNGQTQVALPYRAGTALVWVRIDDTAAFRPADPRHGFDEPQQLFLCPDWRGAVAFCTDRLIITFHAAQSPVLDTSGSYAAYLVNGTEFESYGEFRIDLRREGAQALAQFANRFPAVLQQLRGGQPGHGLGS